MAIGSLICGLLFLFFPAAIAAIILGHLSHSQIRKSAERLKGSGLATGGLVLGYLGVVILPVVLIVAAIAIPNLLRAKMAANEAVAVGSVRTLNTACVTYSGTYGGFPPVTQRARRRRQRRRAVCNRSPVDRQRLQTGRKSGYDFHYSAGPIDNTGVIASYADQCEPRRAGQHGFPLFFHGPVRSDSR